MMMMIADNISDVALQRSPQESNWFNYVWSKMFDFERIIFSKTQGFSRISLISYIAVSCWSLESCRKEKLPHLTQKFQSEEAFDTIWKSPISGVKINVAGVNVGKCNIYCNIFRFSKNQSSLQDQDWQPLKNVRMIKQQLCRVGGVGGKYICLEIDHRNRK